MSFSITTLKGFTSAKFGPARNWNTYCQYTDNSLSGYGVLVNGLEFYSAGSVAFTGSVAINFNQDVQNLITDYGATVTYQIYRAGPGTACKYTPDPLTGSVTVGMSDIVITSPVGCGNSIDISVTLTVAGMPNGWWNTFCCGAGYCTYTASTGWTTQAVGITLN